MKRGFLREKAIFQIILVVIAVIYFSYAIKPVAASDVCCEKTTSGQHCVYGDSSACDPNYMYSGAASCEDTSYCSSSSVGCCYDLNEGLCYRSVLPAACRDIDGGELYTDETCRSVAVCQPGCCVVGSQCRFTTEQSCAIETSKYPGLEIVYDPSITSESACQAICLAGDKGCCMNTDNSCMYETRESCDAGGGTFYDEKYCSEVSLCGCTSHYSKTCYDDDVYWVDSCGNTEEKAEDCDYASGTLCKDISGEKRCGTLNCETTYSDEKNVHDSRMGGFRKNGESWCIYESPVGEALDRPGTRHYRHMCVNGQEIVESCRDYREEICIQGEQEGITGSQCLHNDIYDSPVTQQISSVPKGQRFWEQDAQSQSLCDQGDSNCPVVWNKKRAGASWKCKGNCECEEPAHVKKMADYCKFMGDCGADFNVLGKYTDDGFSVTGAGREGPPSGLSDTQIQQWNKYGVFGGMIGLYEIILDFIEAILASGMEEARDVEEAMADLKQTGTYAMVGTALVSYMALTTVGTVGTAMASIMPWAFTVAGLCWFCAVIIVIILIIIYIFTMTGDSKTYHVTTDCSEWQAPTGGSDCDKCLDQKKVDELGFYDTCTEYKCKSLGQNCEFILENSGTERVACYDANPNDVNSPVISPWEEALTEGFDISTITQGYEITPKAPYYEKIEFGIKTNELSQCKIAKEHTDSYDSMALYFGDNFYQLQHHITINPQAGGQTYEYYIRCQDPSGNKNAADYLIRFITTDEPDTTAPHIEGTSIEDYGYVAADVDETPLAIYTNEPANCRWSLTDKSYDEMENTFRCEDSPTNALSYDTHPCYTLLNITEGVNDYFFRCEDKSEVPNKMQQGYTFHLTKTNELTITSQGPEGTLLDTVTPMLTATTAGGAENGKATCYYSDDNTRDFSLWPELYETESTSHSQKLLLEQGEHNYYITCKDIAGNEASTTISFTIDKDIVPPNMQYIYMDSVALHIILDEPSTCEYSDKTFSYGKGTQMSGTGTTHNTVSVSEPYYYINCEDTYNNHWRNPIIVYL